MEAKSLLLGLFFTFGSFAVKSGIGLYYALVQNIPKTRRVLFLVLYSLGYFLLFMGSAYILQRVNLLAYVGTVQNILGSGMLIHMLMAGMLLIWGIFLLKHAAKTHQHTYGWLALVFPCPVCLLAILLSAGFLVTYFPDTAYFAVISAYAGFIMLNVLTIIGVHIWKIQSGHALRSILGTSMMAIAGYFLLSVIFMPQFGDLDRVYRLACYQDTVQTLNTQSIVCFFMMTSLILLGFYFKSRKIRRVRHD